MRQHQPGRVPRSRDPGHSGQHVLQEPEGWEGAPGIRPSAVDYAGYEDNGEEQREPSRRMGP